MQLMTPDTNVYYALGQLAAVLGRANAFRSESRAIEIATLTPARILTPALAEATRKGMSRPIRERVEEIMGSIPAMPTRALISEEQGFFQLGYYHEGARLRGGRPPKAESDATLTARWEILIEPDLKVWAMQHGGAGLVRRLLERERADAAR
jgi:hypothetical protein